MTIETEINRIKQNIANCYTTLTAKGATMPAVENVANLAACIRTIPAGAADNFVTQSGDTIVTSAGTPLATDGISSLTTAPSITDTQLTFADDGNSTVSFSMQQLKDYVSPAPAKQGRFVCASDAKIAYSDDGLSWTEINNPLENRFTVCYGDGKFLGMFTSASDKIAYSTDGIYWTTSTMPTSLVWSSIVYGNGIFVAYGYSSASLPNNVYAYSTDGINWTQGTLPASNIWGNVYFVNGKFYINYAGNSANPSNVYLYSTDGINWTQGTLPTSGNWHSVGGDEKVLFTLFGGGYADTNRYYYSTDGVNWTNGVLPSVSYWGAVFYGNGIYIIDAGYRSNIYAYSSDGINWTSKASPINNKSISSFCGEKFFTSSYNTDTYKYSSDGITWQTGTLPSSQTWMSIAYGTVITN